MLSLTCFTLILLCISCNASNSTLYLYYEACEANTASQQFTYDISSQLLQFTTSNNEKLCASATGNSDPIMLKPCDATDTSQKWTFTSNGQFKSTKNSCFDVYQNEGPPVDEWTCKAASDPTVANQEWTIKGSQIISKINGVFCLTAHQSGCPYDGWSTHQLQVDSTSRYSLINSTTPGVFANQSKYGMEGGQIVLVEDRFYLFITEFTGDPLYVPSNLTLWSITMTDFQNGDKQWSKVSSLYQSGGTCDCNNTRASLGSSISVAYNETNSRWYIFYVGFQSCNNDSFFVNRNGRIWIAESQTVGIKGITGPYKDIDVIMKYPDPNQQPWEGLQGVDSFSNPYKVNDTYWAFYGSAQTQNNPCCNQEVGLAHAPSYYGPWTRAAYPQINPVKLLNSPLEQPIVIEFKDGTYGAVFDALYQQNAGDVGYAWSPDGIHWSSACMQLLTVNPPNGAHWGDARTPEGLIPIDDTHFYLFFTGWDEAQQNQNYEAFGYVNVSFVNSQSN